MRALFVSTPGIGHVFAMVPLAWALRTAGHEVLVATAGAALAAGRAGLAVADVAPGFGRDQVRAQLRQRPDLAAQLAALRHAQLQDLRQAADYVAVLSNLLVDGVMEVARAWRPDLVVQSQVDGAGLVTAGALGVPAVAHGFGLARTAGMVHMLRERMVEAFARHGVSGTTVPRAAIDVAPPSMIDAAEGWPMRYVPYNGGGLLPAWLLEPAARRPRVAVTLGTVQPHRHGIDVIPRIIAATDSLDVDLVLALGDSTDISALGTLPPHVRVAGWVPLNALLPSCTAIIHHGGAGSTMAALDAGVPQLILPSGADRYINATAVHDRGAGVRADPATLDSALLERLVHDPTLRVAAAEVQAEIRAMPRPVSLLPRLNALIA